MTAIDIKEYFNRRDTFAAFCGITITGVEPGRAQTRMEVRPHHLNGVGTVHGGAIFTLADLAFAAACNSHGTVAVAINANIYYVKAVSAGTLTADAREISRGGKIATYAIDVKAEDGSLIATFDGMAYRKRDPLP